MAGDRAQVSIELQHVYGLWTAASESAASRAAAEGDDALNVLRASAQKIARRAAASARTWLTAHIAADTSTCLLIDDYFRYRGEWNDQLHAEDVAEIMDDAFADAGLTVHYIVSEAGLASSASALLEQLVPSPVEGEGSSARGPEAMWLTNHEPAMGRAPARSDRRSFSGVETTPDDTTADDGRSPGVKTGFERAHSIRLEVETHSSSPDRQDMSCMVLAAWWQLLRLGVADVDLTTSGDDGAVLLRASPDVSLVANRTLSLLPSDLLNVECAVRLILQHVVAPPNSWTGPVFDADRSFEESVLDRIAYILVPDLW